MSNWDFVPAHSALVLESGQTLQAYDSVKNRTVWSAFSGISELGEWELKLEELDSIVPDKSIRAIFGDKGTLVALFPISVTTLDALFIIDLEAPERRNYLKEIGQHYKETGYRNKSRQYNGFTIEEYYKPSEGDMFSYVRHGHLLIASYTPFLVEDAIRTFNEPKELSFKTNFVNVLSLNPLVQDDGNLYLNMQEFGALLNLFPETRLRQVNGSGFLDVKLDQSAIKLSGFVFPETGLLTTFSSEPQSFNLLEIVPNNVSLLRHYSFEDAAEWRPKLKDLYPEIEQISTSLKNHYDIDSDFLFSQIGNEFAVAQMEVVGSEPSDRLLFFDVKDRSKTAQYLKQMTLRMSVESIFTDQMGAYQISKLDDPKFSRCLLGRQSELSKECYYMMYQNFVVMSNSIAQLKKLIQAIENDNTWRKSLKINQLIDLSSREANYSLIVNVPRYWNELMRSLKPEWATYFQSVESGIKSLEYAALQFNRVDDKFYTSAVAYQSQPPRQPAKMSTYDKVSLPFDIVTKPFIQRSHVNQSLEVLVQDSARQLYHLSSDLDILWTKPLKAPITSAIHGVDFYNNGKKQYAFISGGSVHILDRTGTVVEGFPVAVPAISEIQYFSIVDYDGSKNYRFMCTDSEGNIFLINKSGAVLDRWNPKATNKKLVTEPKHIRVAGTDAFVTMSKDEIDLVTRRGISYSGFPVKFEENLVGNYFTEATGSFSTSTLTTLTVAGEIVRINFGGRIEFRDQLYKPEVSAIFELVPDVLENTFLITRSSRNLWEVLDASGNKLFEKAYVKNENSSTQFYRFGGDNTLIIVSDKSEELSTIYDLSGRILTQSGLKSSNPLSVLHFENQGLYEFYLTEENSLRKVRNK